MAERASKLHWHGPDVHGMWIAEAGPCSLTVQSIAIDEFGWTVASEAKSEEGHAFALADAVSDAEDAALQLLREGVEALGGRVVMPRSAEAKDDLDEADHA